nr:choice-of-anchor J domain-containing protein [Ornithinimicrobium sp. HY1793]
MGAPAVSADPPPPDGDQPSLLATADSTPQASESTREALEGVESETGLWIVQAESAPVAQFGTTSAGAEAHAEKLVAEQADLEAEIASTLGRDVTVAHTYTNVLNAIAVEADADEAAQLWDVEGVTAVYPDAVRELDTDVSHEVIKSAAAWDGANAPEIATKGEGLIVAMIDSGVNPEHPAFAAEGGDGYVHTNPLGAGTFLGACNTEAGLECNDKLIGAYTYNGPTARDNDGHGSHTGSTMAGNAHTAQFTLGTADFEREVSGVAPHANVISYKVCAPGCPSSATIAAVDQAITDNVDVINYSISGSDDPWLDPVDLAFLDAHDAGISVSASGGNDGPGASTVAKTGPWNLSVAATTHNRVFGNPVSITDDGAPAELVGIPGFPGDGPGITEVFAGGLFDAEAVTPGNANGCAAFPADAFADGLALIQRGDCNFADKVVNAQAAGAIAVVMYNNVSGPPTAPGGLETTTIPAVMTTLESGQALQAYLADNEGAQASIGTDVVLVEDDTWTDLVAGFSSRGPSQFDMLAPTLAAPGVNILAAYDGDPLDYNVISGTSMASPHAAGAVALLREVYPDLTPTQLRSVLASTADTDLFKEDGSTPADAFDIGSGRINIEQAGRAGLALDETSENFVAANPDVGGEPSTLNLPAFVETACEGECSWTRTVTSIADGAASYTATVEAPEGVTVTVTPETFTLESGASQEITVTADVSSATVGSWAFGNIALETTDQHADGSDIAGQHLPVAVNTASNEVPSNPPVIDVDPSDLEATQRTDTVSTQTLTIGNTGGEDLTWEFVTEVNGEGSVLAEQEVNGTSGIVSDDFPNDGGGVFAADDFTLAADASLDLVHTPGFWTGMDLAERVPSIDWQIFADADGVPGEQVWAHTSAPDGAGVSTVDNEITLDIDAATGATIDLTAGTYWLSVYPTVTDPSPNLNDRWNWYQGTPSGNPGMLIDEDFLFGPGTGDWTPIVDLVGTFSDLAYRIEGDAEPIACGADWLTLDPTSGTTAPDGSTEVTASFDSAGLANGDYTADLCLESNDPAALVTTVPVTLTVADSAAITVDPTSIEGTQLTDEQTEQTLTIGNAGTADLEVTISEVEAAAAASDVERPELPVGTDRAHASADGAGAAVAPAVVEPAAVPTVASLSEGFDDVTALPGAGWAMTNNSEPVGGTNWFQGNPDVMAAYEGASDAYVGANFNNAGVDPGHISNWLMTPEVDLVNGSEFSFWTSTPENPATYVDRLEVRLSTSGDSTDVGSGYDGVGDFDTLLLSVNPDLTPTGYPGEWTQYTATIEGLEAPTTGRIGLHYFVPDGGPLGVNSSYIGVDTVSYEAAEVPPACEVTDAAWLTVDPTTGTITPGDELAVTVGLDSTGLAVGDHTADLCIESNDPDAPVTTVPVTLSVTDAPPAVPVIQVDPTSVELELETGDTGSSAVSVANTGEADLDFDVIEAAAGDSCEVADAAWLAVTPTTGTVAPGADTDLALAFDAAGLEAGEHTAALCISSNDAQSPTVTVPVTLTVTEEEAPPEPAEVVRIDGDDRYETATLIASEFPDGASTVYVANGLADAQGVDALVTGAVAGGGPDVAADGAAPILLVKDDDVPQAVTAALADLDPEKIVIVGGQLAVHPSVEAELAETGADVSRIGGGDRFETAAALAEDYPTGGTVFVATGTGAEGAELALADALTSASAAGSQEVPVLLTQADNLPNVTEAALADLAPEQIVLVGGPIAVSAEVEAALGEIAPTTRVFGDNRYETAVALSADYPVDSDRLYVASGTNFPDALVGAALTASQDAPLLITRSDKLPHAVAAEAERLSPQGITLFGGPIAINTNVEEALQAILDLTSID